MDDWQALIRRVIEERAHLIDQVCLAAIRDGRYGVLVDGQGARLSADVPPLTIHYVNDLGDPTAPWTAEFAPPEDVPSVHG